MTGEATLNVTNRAHIPSVYNNATATVTNTKVTGGSAVAVPPANAICAQVATMLHRYIKLTIGANKYFLNSTGAR
ncbi:MAG: hypothetical protein ACOX2T_03635 [bacterium]